MFNQRLDGEVVTGKTRGAIVVPAETIVEHNGQTSAVRVQYGKVDFVPVSIGRREGTQVEVTAGVSAGDLLVMPRQVLEQGQHITATTPDPQFLLDPAGYPLRVEYTNVPVISTADLDKQYDNTIIVDLSDRFVFSIVHVAKAINIPYAEPNYIGQLKDLRSKFGEKPIVVYCDDRTCAASYETVREAQRNGINKIFAYDGGLAEWIQISPQRTALLGQSSMVPDRLVSSEYFQARILSNSDLAGHIRDPDAVLIQIGDKASNTDSVFTGVNTLTPEEFSKKLAGGNYRDKELLITGLKSGQARWLQYLLEDGSHKNYLFGVNLADGRQLPERKS
jgi:rhodanese-related sulfurtransferase